MGKGENADKANGEDDVEAMGENKDRHRDMGESKDEDEDMDQD